MKEYDLIIIGTGSAMNLVEPFLKRNPEARIAVIDKDQPGGICLTRGCIPSKLLVYPAELVELARRMPQFGLDVVVRRIDFAKVMERMREHVHPEMEGIRRGLTEADQLDYYHDTARFTAPYTLRVGAETLHSRFIILCTGSEAVIPPIEGIEDVDYLTSDTLLALTRLPSSLLIVGGGYIAAEYGHFFAAMGSEVTVVGRNPQFLPNEEPEVSDVALRMLGRRMRILTNHEAVKVAPSDRGATLWARDRATDRRTKLDAEALLIAAGRGPTSRHLSPEKGGIQTTEQGWIEADEYLQTSQPGVWTMGDATGRFPFKHKANEDSYIVYRNAILGERAKADYPAVPHAIFTDPEIAAVGMRQAEAAQAVGEENLLVGFHRYAATAKGASMGATEEFVKVLVDRESTRILGAHIIGPQASVLIQSVINLMYTSDGSAQPMLDAMHIHPALPEVVQRAFGNLLPAAEYDRHRQHEAAPELHA